MLLLFKIGMIIAIFCALALAIFGFFATLLWSIDDFVNKPEVQGIRIKGEIMFDPKVGEVKKLKVVAFDASNADLSDAAFEKAVVAWTVEASAELVSASGMDASVLFKTAGNSTVSVSATYPNGDSFTAGQTFVVSEVLAGPPAEMVGIKIVEA